jgi:hypothetical protein
MGMGMGMGVLEERLGRIANVYDSPARGIGPDVRLGSSSLSSDEAERVRIVRGRMEENGFYDDGGERRTINRGGWLVELDRDRSRNRNRTSLRTPFRT